MLRARRLTAIASLVPLALASQAAQAAPAQAASGSVSLTILDRSGHATHGGAYVVNLKTNVEDVIRGGQSRKLPNGRYAIVVNIAQGRQDEPGYSQTLAGKVFTVKGRKVAVRLDARQGRRIKITPSVPDPWFSSFDAGICVDGHQVESVGVAGGTAYAVPSKARELQFFYGAHWAVSQAGPFYYTARKTAHGIPPHMTFDHTKTKFARLSVRVLRGTVKSRKTSILVNSASDFACTPSVTQSSEFSAPRTVTAYVTTGTWELLVWHAAGIDDIQARRFVAGHRYKLTLNRTR